MKPCKNSKNNKDPWGGPLLFISFTCTGSGPWATISFTCTGSGPCMGLWFLRHHWLQHLHLHWLRHRGPAFQTPVSRDLFFPPTAIIYLLLIIFIVYFSTQSISLFGHVYVIYVCRVAGRTVSWWAYWTSCSSWSRGRDCPRNQLIHIFTLFSVFCSFHVKVVPVYLRGLLVK